MVVSSTNKKVRNATKCEYNGIKFRSKLELFCYRELLKLDVIINYEAEQFTIVESFGNSVHLFQPNRSKNIEEKNCKFLPIKYTPDFTLLYKNKYIVVECKGRPNDAYPLRKKLFLKYFGELAVHFKNAHGWECYFMEPHNQQQVLQCMEIIKSL